LALSDFFVSNPAWSLLQKIATGLFFAAQLPGYLAPVCETAAAITHKLQRSVHARKNPLKPVPSFFKSPDFWIALLATVAIY
jgi:hypothetical protein